MPQIIAFYICLFFVTNGTLVKSDFYWGCTFMVSLHVCADEIKAEREHKKQSQKIQHWNSIGSTNNEGLDYGGNSW